MAAGLDGIKNQLECPEGFDVNMFDMTEEEREKAGIESLPLNLKEAINEFEKDEFVQNVLGKHISEKYLSAKTSEWADYTSQVTQWELDRYLYKF